MTKVWTCVFLLLFFPCWDQRSAADEPAAPKREPPTVRLIDAGTGPMSTLRVTAKKGDKQSVVMTMTMAMEMAVSGQAFPSVKLPPMQMTLDLEVTEVTSEGDLRYSFKMSKADVVEDPAVMPQVKEMLKTQLQTLVGVTGNALVTNRGITKEADLQYPPGMDAGARQLMDGMKENMNQIAAPFPEEAVGQGASWEVTNSISQSGLTLKQTAVYTLAELARSSGTTKIAITQKADPQEMKSPGLPPGTKIHLEEMSSTGEGETHFDLSRLAPPTASMQLKMSMRSMIEAAGEKQPMTMKMEMGMKLEGK